MFPCIVGDALQRTVTCVPEEQEQFSIGSFLVVVSVSDIFKYILSKINTAIERIETASSNKS